MPKETLETFKDNRGNNPEEQPNSPMSRRDFIRMATAGAVGLVLTGGCDRDDVARKSGDEEKAKSASKEANPGTLNDEARERIEKSEKFLSSAYFEINEARVEEDNDVLVAWINNGSKILEAIDTIKKSGKTDIRIENADGQYMEVDINVLEDVFLYYINIGRVFGYLRSEDTEKLPMRPYYDRYLETIEGYKATSNSRISELELILRGMLSNYLCVDPDRYRMEIQEAVDDNTHDKFDALVSILKKDLIAFDRFVRVATVQDMVYKKLSQGATDVELFGGDLDDEVDGLFGFNSTIKLRRVLRGSENIPLDDDKEIRKAIAFSDDIEYRKLLSEISESEVDFSYKKPVFTESGELSPDIQTYKNIVKRDLKSIIGNLSVDNEVASNMFRGKDEIYEKFGRFDEIKRGIRAYVVRNKMKINTDLKIGRVSDKEAVEMARVLFVSAIDALSEIHSNKKPIKTSSGDSFVLPFDTPNLDCSTFLRDVFLVVDYIGDEDKTYTKWSLDQVEGYSSGGKVIMKSGRRGLNYKNLNSYYDEIIKSMSVGGKGNNSGERAYVVGAKVYGWAGRLDDLGHVFLVITNEAGEMVVVEKVGHGPKKIGIREKFYDNDFLSQSLHVSDLLSDENMKRWIESRKD